MNRNGLIKEGLIKDKPTSWCREVNTGNPCYVCTTDAMCTKKDLKTGEFRHTFIKKYKKEHRVTRQHFYLIIIRPMCTWGPIIGSQTLYADEEIPSNMMMYVAPPGSQISY